MIVLKSPIRKENRVHKSPINVDIIYTGDTSLFKQQIYTPQHIST